MIEIGQGAIEIGESALLAALLVFLRVGGLVMFVPAFGERLVPQRVRLAAALAFTVIVLPAVPAIEVPPLRTALVGLIASESLVGVTLGLTLRLVLIALQLTASMIAQATSLAQVFGGSTTEPMPAIGHVLVMGGLALACLSGLPVMVAGLLIDSYGLLPAGVLLDPAELAEFGIAQVAYCFRLAFTLAAPFVLAAFVYNLALGAINRAMPQLMVVLVGAPAITGAGLAMLALLAPVLLPIWFDALQAVLTDPLGMR